MTNLDAESVLAAMTACIEEAKKLGIDIVVHIVDAAGNSIGSISMPGSFLASDQYAFWKAWTAASFKMCTKDFAAHMSELDSTIAEDLISHKQVTRLPGGFPICQANKVIGAIGVSGGIEDQDEICANAALNLFS